VMERRYGSFLRSLRLPDTVDEDKVEASFNNGVLKVSLPKRPEAIGKQRTIPIKKG
jgi:HSP20 family protein